MNKANLPKEPESKMQIRFPDCDPFNHLNNARYIDYMINAREDHLVKFYDFDIYKLVKETGNTWVVAQTQIAYLTSAELMETITIQTSLISFNGKSLQMEAKMYNENKTQLKAIMWLKLAHYNLKTRKSQEHTTSLMEFFTEVHFPIDNNPSFDERVKSLKSINAN
jgi:YbgC/YbaW family acyl-CoA thioester hydrolase